MRITSNVSTAMEVQDVREGDGGVDAKDVDPQAVDGPAVGAGDAVGPHPGLGGGPAVEDAQVPDPLAEARGKAAVHHERIAARQSEQHMSCSSVPSRRRGKILNITVCFVKQEKRKEMS